VLLLNDVVTKRLTRYSLSQNENAENEWSSSSGRVSGPSGRNIYYIMQNQAVRCRRNGFTFRLAFPRFRWKKRRAEWPLNNVNYNLFRHVRVITSSYTSCLHATVTARTYVFTIITIIYHYMTVIIYFFRRLSF